MHRVRLGRPGLFVVLAGFLLAAVGVVASPAGAGDRARYIIRLSDPALASYEGGIGGLVPTMPAARGEHKLDVSSPASRAYLAHLTARHGAAELAMQAALGRALDVVFDYRYAYNGMAVELSAAEAATVRRLPGVTKVQPDFERHIVTDAGPAWIGAPSIWDGTATGGPPGTKGEGVVVGVIDTGVNFDHPSFADVGGDGFNHTNPRGQFLGLCDPILGLPFCNGKLIGVYDFTGTTPHDDNGHGSHTASTAAGNVVDATLNAPTISVTKRISGVAPHANLITYKACLAIGSCVGTSLVAAIDQATADGVDIVNYSIGGGPVDPWNDADSEAFLGARDAGVFASVSAGNSGPQPETVGSPANAPWVMSVGASTHDRALVNRLVGLTGGATPPPDDINGRSLTAGYGPAAIVSAADFGDPLCGTPFLPGTFHGEIVICDRGVNPRVEKGRNVELGGAGGMVLANTAAEGESTVADAHELPAVHIGFADAETLKAWVGDGGAGHTATISGTVFDQAASFGDVMAGFSSRGPNKPAPDIIKPDVTAPGVDILAAYSTPTEFNVISGTSMSSPHSAGAAALVRAVHPAWTPAEVQSALTSTGVTASVRKDDGTTAADPFDMGGGRIDLTRGARAGLVLDETRADYDAANPAAGGDPATLNLATLGQGDCRGKCSWNRTAENVSGSTVTWHVQVDAPSGLQLSVKPSQFTLAPGQTVGLHVTADVKNLPGLRWVFAQVRLVPNVQGLAEQHLPVAVQPVAAERVDIEAMNTSGTHTIQVTTPVNIRRFSATVSGLREGAATSETVVQDPTPLDPYDTVDPAIGTFFVLAEAPAGSRVLATEITATTSLDLDLYVGLDSNGNRRPDAGEEVCASASETAFESCSLTEPATGTYWVLVQNFLTGRVVDDVQLVTAVVPGTNNGNLTVTGPAGRVATGTTFDVSLRWNEPAMEVGDVWFALVQMASDRNHVGNVASKLVAITRTE